MPLKKRKLKIKKKLVKKKPAKKAPVKKKALKKKALKGNLVGEVTHYFPKVRAAVIKLKTALAVGDTIRIKGHTTEFRQSITSMQIDRVPINTAKKGQEIGLLVNSRVRSRDKVFKESQETA